MFQVGCFIGVYCSFFFPAGASSTRRLSQKIGMAANAFESSCLGGLLLAVGATANNVRGISSSRSAAHFLKPRGTSRTGFLRYSHRATPCFQLARSLSELINAHETGLMQRYRFVEEMPC